MTRTVVSTMHDGTFKVKLLSFVFGCGELEGCIGCYRDLFFAGLAGFGVVCEEFEVEEHIVAFDPVSVVMDSGDLEFIGGGFSFIATEGAVFNPFFDLCCLYDKVAGGEDLGDRL